MRTSERVATILDRLKDIQGEPARRSTGDPIRGLVGTILSQNTSDVNASRALDDLTEAFPTWEDVLAADVSEIEDAIRSGGLAVQKARTIKRALAAVRSRSSVVDGAFLDDLDDDAAMAFLMSIKGVGQKTAACVLMFDLERDVLPVDTHVHRVSRRIGLVPDNTDANKSQQLLEEQIAPQDRYAAHILFIRHGRTICRSRNPKCEECAVNGLCDYAAENIERIA